MIDGREKYKPLLGKPYKFKIYARKGIYTSSIKGSIFPVRGELRFIKTTPENGLLKTVN